MSVTQAQAWAIFDAEKRGHAEEAEAAIAKMTGGEYQEYQEHLKQINLELAQVGIEAQNEAAAITEDNPTTVAELATLAPHEWKADQYIQLVSMFKGSKFEALHLTAIFRIPNAELLLGMVKP